MNAEQEVTVTDNEGRGRYEITVNGSSVGYAAYRRSESSTVFTHTEISPEGEGRGYGSMLARAALDQEKAAHWQVVPECPFIAGYIRRHPEYLDVVAEDRTSAPGDATRSGAAIGDGPPDQ